MPCAQRKFGEQFNRSVKSVDNKEKFFTNTWVTAICACICCALWGSAFPFIKIGYELFKINDSGTRILFAGIRFFLAGTFTMTAMCIKNRKLVYPKKENVHIIFKVSLFQTFLQYMFFYIGLAYTSGVKGSLIDGASVFFAIIISSLIFRQEKLTFTKAAACIIGLAGVTVINLNGLELSVNCGDVCILVSSVAYAVSSVLIKRYSEYENPVVISGCQFVVGGMGLIILGLLLGGRLETVSAAAVGVLIYLAFLSAAAYSLWGILLKYNPVSKITVFSFTIQIFGIILSSVMLKNEVAPPFLNCITALMLICLGIYLVNRVGDEK